jgi:DNA adenine methylase
LSRQPIKSYGGKHYLTKLHLQLIPPHEVYCEPFAGGAALFWAKDPSPLEILNDIDFRIVAFYRCLRDERLWQRLQELCELTPYSRAEFYSVREKLKRHLGNPRNLDEFNDDELLELAWAFYVFNRQSFSAAIANPAWSFPKANKGVTLRAFRNTIAEFERFHLRLRNVVIECDDAINVIKRYDAPNTFFFVDPPYLPETLNTPKNYLFQMTSDQHRELLVALRQAKGKVLITHPKCPLYDEMLSDWKVFGVTYRNTSAIGKGAEGAKVKDALWLNYAEGSSGALELTPSLIA